MTTAAAAEPKVHGQIYELPVASVHPDPEQPRIDVDDELAASIKEHGFYDSQPIEVRVHPTLEDAFMIIDGERRWRGAGKAGLRTLYATINTSADVFISTADRLVKQIVSNKGKPLTVVEEAFAFQRIVDDRRAAGDKTYGPVQLARELTIAKSTASDRLTLASLPKLWLDQVKNGRIQPSAAPIIARWRGVPEEFQRRAFAGISQEWQWQKAGNKAEPIENDDVERILWTHFKKYIRPLSEVGAEYKGPVVEMKGTGYGEVRKKYATDPSQWQPIVNRVKREAAKRAKEKAKKTGGKKAATTAPKGITIPVWVKALIARGATRKAPQQHQYQWDGEFLSVEASKLTWQFGRDDTLFDPTTLMEKLAPSKVTVWIPSKKPSYGSARIHLCTSDTSAMSAAKSVVAKASDEAFARIQAALIAKLSKHKATVTGAGAQHLLVLLLEQDEQWQPRLATFVLDVGRALEFKGFDTLKAAGVKKHVAAMSAAEAAQLASAIAGVMALGLSTPDEQLGAWTKKERDRLAKAHPKDWPALGKDVAAKGDEEVEDDESGEQPTADEIDDMHEASQLEDAGDDD